MYISRSEAMIRIYTTQTLLKETLSKTCTKDITRLYSSLTTLNIFKCIEFLKFKGKMRGLLPLLFLKLKWIWAVDSGGRVSGDMTLWKDFTSKHEVLK
jgi:hypothetical protein